MDVLTLSFIFLPVEVSDVALKWITNFRKLCRTGNVSKSVAEPQKRNLFIKSLYEEELDALHTDNNMDNGKNEHETDICDKDIVDNLDDTVKYWTDYSKVHYHPKSLYEINGLWVDSQEFNNYGIGRDAYSSGRGEEICERLRFFIEECDHIQVRFSKY